MKHINNTEPCLLFDDCTAHYNETGYEILAKVAYELLLDRQLLGEIGIQNKPGKINSAGP
jgi:hypothetical protein